MSPPSNGQSGRSGVRMTCDREIEMPRKPTDEELDQELEDSFPASDPPSLTEPAGDARRREREADDD